MNHIGQFENKFKYIMQKNYKYYVPIVFWEKKPTLLYSQVS